MRARVYTEITMVESGKEYILQWSGHAAHVTERFSSLLARQALVDVTLICQGQKLCVHKLVLASCSLYFEEMLIQDLGQEPIILLKDLDFEVLKAMVEFMYCGETTISHCHLQAVLDAAQVFKVKELECIVKSMIGCEKNAKNSLLEFQDIKGSVVSLSNNKNCIKARPSGERYNETSITTDIDNSVSLECKFDQTVEINGEICNEDDNIEGSLCEANDTVNETTIVCQKEQESMDKNSAGSLDSSYNETSKISTDEDVATTNGGFRVLSPKRENDLKTILAERGCDYFNDTIVDEKEAAVNENSIHSHIDSQDLPSGVGECTKVYTHKKRKFADCDTDDYSLENFNELLLEPLDINKSFAQYSRDSQDTANKVDKLLKVYTHRRRKSVDRNKSPPINICDSLADSTSTDCIDLSDDTSHNNTPVTLPTALDMETSEYIWSLSAETIQSVVGCTINQSKTTNSIKERALHDCDNMSIDVDRSDTPTNHKRVREMKELFSVCNGNLDIETPPVLRRSVRINQLENDDSINNNSLTLPSQKGRDKPADITRDDYSGNSIVSLTKSKRKANKELDPRISDENNVTTSQPVRKNTNNSRSLRSTSKLASRKPTAKNRCAFTRNEKDEIKTKSNARIKCEKSDKDQNSGFVPTKLNTIASVDRALWGDMSDVLENRENGTDVLSDYSPSKEIPFAVGLLPLRAALERMQATLDHQPRKTRSSVAPLRQDSNGFKRKITINDTDYVSGSKKHCNLDSDIVGTANAVCHIQIRTSSQCTQNRRPSPSEQMVAVGSTSETNTR